MTDPRAFPHNPVLDEPYHELEARSNRLLTMTSTDDPNYRLIRELMRELNQAGHIAAAARYVLEVRDMGEPLGRALEQLEEALHA